MNYLSLLSNSNFLIFGVGLLVIGIFIYFILNME